MCSSYSLLHSNFQTLQERLLRLGYGRDHPDSQLQAVLDGVHNVKEPTDTVEKRTVLLVLPYLGYKSGLLKRQVSRLVRGFYPQTMARILFRTAKLSHRFGTKDPTPYMLRSGVVYEYTCPHDGCAAFYVGATSRHLCDRCLEHNRMESAIKVHLLDCHDDRAPPNLEDFRILQSVRGAATLRVTETLAIKEQQPSINNTNASTTLILY